MHTRLTPYAAALLKSGKASQAAGLDQSDNDQSVIPAGSVAPGVPAQPIVTPPFARGGPPRREGGRRYCLRITRRSSIQSNKVCLI
jgi:hypothetical protein